MEAIVTLVDASQPIELARAASQSLPMLLLRLREAVLLPLRPVIREFDMTEQQARVLLVLSETDTLEMLALADACCLRAPSLSRIVPKLRARGWVGCHRVDADERRTKVALLPEGLAIAAGLKNALRQVHDETKRQLSGSRLHTLIDELQAAISTLGSVTLTDALEDADDGA